MKVVQEIVPNVNMVEIAEDYFHNIDVSINNVPDLTKAPFHLAAPGICGYPKLVDVGGQQYLSPTPQLDHRYDLRSISNLIDIPEALFIGAGAGPYHEIGTNSELICNVKFGKNYVVEKNCSYVAKEIPNENPSNYLIEPLKSTQFAILGNFLASKGMGGKAIRISVSRSKSEAHTDFLEVIRSCIKEEYKDTFVGLGGTFVLKSGMAKIHVMPDFCPDPLETDEKMLNWLKFYEVPAPLTCLGVLVNKDYKELNLRAKHAHCFQTTLESASVIDHEKINVEIPGGASHKSTTNNKQATFDFEKLKYGGHYHYDTIPEESSYEGYFVPVQTVCRIDQPGK